MNNSRQRILDLLKAEQRVVPPLSSLQRTTPPPDVVPTFIRVLEGIGGIAYTVKSYYEAEAIIRKDLVDLRRIVSPLAEFAGLAEFPPSDTDLTEFDDVDLFITSAPLAVAENGAVWLPESNMSERILPYICRHLIVFVEPPNIVGTMHDAYSVIANHEYGFACFIAGPSKTADIEQSLVMGAHGPVSMRVFIMETS